MDHRVAKLALAVALIMSSMPSYESANHTVGGTAGWFYDNSTNSPAVDYSAWAAAETFNLGDLLIFITDINMVVVQTYNSTTYDLCGRDDDESYAALYYYNGTAGPTRLRIVVVLDVAGPNYYLSGTLSGTDGSLTPCENGMRFQINVGSDPSSTPPAPDAETPTNSPSTPETTTPASLTTPSTPPTMTVPSTPKETPTTPGTPTVSITGRPFSNNGARVHGGRAGGILALMVVLVAVM